MGEMQRDLAEELRHAMASLPLLPMPGTVFFPNTLLPLHVCDAPYLRLLDEVLPATRWLGVVLQRAGQSQPHRVGQIAKVIQHTRWPDGRYDLMLQGMGRLRLEEMPETGAAPSLRARCHLLASHEEEAVQVAAEVQAFRSCYQKFLELCPEQPDVLAEVCSGIQEPDMLADVICATLLDDIDLRQQALEERSCIRRLQLVGAALSATALKRLERDGPIH